MQNVLERNPMYQEKKQTTNKRKKRVDNNQVKHMTTVL